MWRCNISMPYKNTRRLSGLCVLTQKLTYSLKQGHQKTAKAKELQRIENSNCSGLYCKIQGSIIWMCASEESPKSLNHILETMEDFCKTTWKQTQKEKKSMQFLPYLSRYFTGTNRRSTSWQTGQSFLPSLEPRCQHGWKIQQCDLAGTVLMLVCRILTTHCHVVISLVERSSSWENLFVLAGWTSPLKDLLTLLVFFF